MLLPLQLVRHFSFEYSPPMILLMPTFYLIQPLDKFFFKVSATCKHCSTYNQLSNYLNGAHSKMNLCDLQFHTYNPSSPSIRLNNSSFAIGFLIKQVTSKFGKNSMRDS
jgi:hypothetical protein